MKKLETRLATIPSESCCQDTLVKARCLRWQGKSCSQDAQQGHATAGSQSSPRLMPGVRPMGAGVAPQAGEGASYTSRTKCRSHSLPPQVFARREGQGAGRLQGVTRYEEGG